MYLNDFVIENNNLVFFDEVKEIELVEIINYKKDELIFKSAKKKNYTCSLFSGNMEAVFLPEISNKKTYLKSITIFPKKIMSKDGILEIYIYENNNGFPKDNEALLEIKKNINDITVANFEITLPKIIKYPEKGLFLAFRVKANNGGLSKRVMDLSCNSESQGYIKSEYLNKWHIQNFPAFQYKLRVLQ